MQRILSVETSRSSNLTSEFITKRLCCSFILTVAFFAVIGGFFLGRFAADKTIQKLKTEMAEIYKKLTDLDKNFKSTFRNVSHIDNCTAFVERISCDHLYSVWKNPEKVSYRTIHQLLDELNTCFT